MVIFIVGIFFGFVMPNSLKRPTLRYWNSPRWLNTRHCDRGWSRSYVPPKLISSPSLPTQAMKNCTTPPGSLLFTNSSVGSFTSQKDQKNERAVRRGLQFFVLSNKTKKIILQHNQKRTTFTRPILRTDSMGITWVLSSARALAN